MAWDWGEFRRGFMRGPTGWAVGFGRGLFTDTIDRVVGSPTLEDRVTVEVTGQPGVTKQQLYFLALAAANGLVRRFGELVVNPARPLTVPGYGTLAIEYDAADHWVRATIGYRWSMSSAVAVGSAGGPNVGDLMDQMAVYRGPQCDLVGAKFDFRTATADTPGVPNPSALPPRLPLENQPILTACPTTPTPTPLAINVAPVPSTPVANPGLTIPSPNPKPPGDNRSRGAVIGNPNDPNSAFGTPVPGPTPSVAAAKCCDKIRLLVPLVYAALTAPATNTETMYAPPTAGPTGG